MSPVAGGTNGSERIFVSAGNPSKTTTLVKGMMRKVLTLKITPIVKGENVLLAKDRILRILLIHKVIHE